MVTAISTSPSAVARSAGVLRYALDIVASDVVEVVSSLGGWMYDHRMAGWHVSVAVRDRRDECALAVLGVKVVDLQEIRRRDDPERAALTVASAERFQSETGVREHGLDAMRDGALVFWGTHCPGPFGGQFGRTLYRPSAAALVFKAHALAAAGIAGARVDLPESVFRERSRPGADMTPV